MKRDLKKWLKSDTVIEVLVKVGFIKEELDLTEEDIAFELLEASHEFDSPADQIQFIWCEAQKQFLKDLLDDLDHSIDKIFNGKDKVKNDKARLVAYESSVKQWLYNKYHYLKQKNGQ